MVEFVITDKIVIPQHVQVEIKPGEIRVKGKKGEISRRYDEKKIILTKKENQILLKTYFPNKKAKAYFNTIKSHILNMFEGVTNGFTYKMKIVYSHFPIEVSVEKDKVLIKNFLHEKKPRIARIVEGTNVRIEKEDIIIEGIDIEKVGQTAANIQNATKIKRKDPRVFMDGIYVYSKSRRKAT